MKMVGLYPVVFRKLDNSLSRMVKAWMELAEKSAN
jgi:hypothetical protein